MALRPTPRLYATNMALGAGGPATAAASGLLLLTWDPPLAPGVPLPPSVLSVAGPVPAPALRTLPWPAAPAGSAFRVAVDVPEPYCGPVRVSLAGMPAAALAGAGGHGACPGAADASVTYERVCGGGAALWAAAPAAAVELVSGRGTAKRCLPPLDV